MTPVQIIAQQDFVLQLFGWLFIIIGMIAQVYQLVINKDRTARYWILVWVFATAHSFVFYFVLNLDRFTALPITPLDGSYTAWSNILRDQWYGTFMIVEIGRALILRSKRHAKP